MSNSSLLSTVIMTGLATALAVGAYQHFTTVSVLQSDLETKQEIIAKLNVDAVTATQRTLITGQSAASSPEAEDQNSSLSSELKTDPWMYGNPRARYSLIELTDTECPYCRDHFPLVQTLVEASGGNINAAILHVPVQGEASRRQAVAVECAGDQGGSEAAWRMMGIILEGTQGNGKGIAQPTPVLAAQLGLNQQRFIACTESVEVIDRITSDLNAAMQMGIAQTPSTLVYDNENGTSILLQGSFASSEGIIDAIEKLTLNPTGVSQ